VHQNSKFVEERLERFFRDRIVPAIYSDNVSLSITAWHAPREPVPFEEAVMNVFEPVSLGWRFGRAWSTIWLKVSGTMPSSWASSEYEHLIPEILVDFGYNSSRSGFQAEALAYNLDGKPIKSIAPKNSWLPWSKENKQIDFYLEVAANPDVAGEYSFAPTSFGDWDTAPETPLYELKKLQLSRRNNDVWELAQDIWTVQGLISSLAEDSTRRHTLLATIEEMLDNLIPDDIAGSATQAREILKSAMSSPASKSSHQIIATGHAHIDSAWLWPIRETVRKCARTFSNVLSLMEEHEEFTFSASSAQHYKWIKDLYPDIFAGITKRVKTGQWRPVGGMWVECDGNLPGSEAMVRQFVYGQKFFQENFGLISKEAWLPDSFGYSAALPQIVKQSGITSFLSQKMSWNQVNKMPHHTFWWEGLDGSRVFTHFPPVDTYISELSGTELSHAERNFSEKGKASISLVPFGWGDGGGGPTREMIAAAYRTNNLEGSPRVKMGSADEFFSHALSEYPNAPVWRGEMYLELHRGVLTSQHRTKQGNRRNESLIREAELWSSYATLKTSLGYPAKELASCWEKILLMQFHDILPGTAIAWVYREVEKQHAEITAVLEGLIVKAISALVTDDESNAPLQELIANARPSAFDGVTSLGIGVVQKSIDTVSLQSNNGIFSLENTHLRMSIDAVGRITSLISLANNRDAIAPGFPANEFQIHNDNPTRWDAWDVDIHYKNSMTVLDEVDEISSGYGDEGEAWVESTRSISTRGHVSSKIIQRITLRPASKDFEIDLRVDWHESEKFLKLAFPINILSEQIAAETQFGHIWRPTHTNTSWDYARFEASQHRFVFLKENHWGVAFANDSTYGYDIERTTDDVGNTITNLRFSLLRATHFPDPEADLGEHTMHFRVRPTSEIGDAIRLGYEANIPARKIFGNRTLPPLVSVSSDQVIIETVKLAEDQSGDLIVRLYESTGERATSKINFVGEAELIQQTNFLEEPLEGVPTFKGSELDIELRAFQVVTLRLSSFKI
jgi:alpha-mannosidase